MRRFSVVVFFTAFIFLAIAPLQAAPVRWALDPEHSAVHFEVKHLLVASVRGSFARVTGTVILDEADLSRSFVAAEVDVSSVYTGSWRRDEALRGDEFFAAGAFPKAQFSSTGVSRGQNGTLLVAGTLSLKGVQRTVTFEVEGPTASVFDAEGREVRAFVARTRIDRKKFGITWQRTLSGGGLLLGDEVRLEILAELVPATVARGEARGLPSGVEAAWVRAPVRGRKVRRSAEQRQ